jgi:hypothetical protein
MSQVQEEVDVWEQLGQHGARMHQVPHKRASTQTGKFWHCPTMVCFTDAGMSSVPSHTAG